MLKLFCRARELDYSELFLVYTQSISEDAADYYADEEEYIAVMRAEEDFCRYIREDFFSVPGSFYAVWELEGKYVSALRMEPYKDGLLLESLETRPDSRRMGYASKLVNSVLSEISAPKIYAHVLKHNIASLKIHFSCGFRKVLDYAVCIDGSVSQKMCTLCWNGETKADI